MSDDTRIKSAVTNEERRTKFRGALIANFPFVQTAANFAMDFGRIEPREDYLWDWYFSEYVDANAASLLTFAPKIHEDLLHYWRTSLVVLSDDHDDCVEEYTDIAYTSGKKKAARKAGSIPVDFPHLKLAKKDLVRAIVSLDKFKVVDPEDVNKWSELSRRSSSTIIRTHQVHQSVIAVIDAKDRAKADTFRAAGRVLGKATSVAITLAKVAHGLPP